MKYKPQSHRALPGKVALSGSERLSCSLSEPQSQAVDVSVSSGQACRPGLASQPPIQLSKQELSLPLSSLLAKKAAPSYISPTQALQSLVHRQGAAVGSGANAADIGILLAVRLNNLMAISRAALVEGEEAQGEDL